LEEPVHIVFRLDEYTWGNIAKLGEGRTGTWAVKGTSGSAGGGL